VLSTKEILKHGIKTAPPQCSVKTAAVLPSPFLPEAFSHNTERVARFQREARMLASLNSSNIAAIYGLEETDSRCKKTRCYAITHCLNDA